jgi:integrase
MRVTAKLVKEYQPPSGKTEHIEYDDEIPGFGARWRRGRDGWGQPRAIFEYALGAKKRRIQLGPLTTESFGTLKDKDGLVIKIGIRERATELRAKVALGQDPADEKIQSKQKAAETFEVVARKFLAFQKDQLRPGSYRHIDRHILKHAKPLHSFQLKSIDRRTAATLISDLRESSGKVAANRVGSTLFHFFRWAMGHGFAENNPFIAIAKFDEKPRERVLTDGELREIWAEAGDDHYGSIIKLLTLTGQRADEMASLRRSEIRKVEILRTRINGVELPALMVDAVELSGERTKNGRPHIVPLSRPAFDILEKQPRRAGENGAVRDLVFGVGDGGFSGWSRCKERLDERILEARVKAWKKSGGHGEEPGPMPHWTHHDLRRTMDTVMNDRLGISPHVVESIVNHISTVKSGKSGVSGTYNRALYLRERTEALGLWADHLMSVVGKNVVSLRAATR